MYKIFPPANTKGDYDSVLPHIVFRRRTLPWERSPDSAGPTSASWLALLVFPTDQAPGPTVGMLSDLYPATTSEGNGTLPSWAWSYGRATAAGSAFLENGQNGSDPCVYLSLTPAQFAACVPSAADLQWNAHARCLTDGTGESTDFAVVVATALPPPGTAVVVHLVSLEGLSDQLPQDDGTFASPPTWTLIRLVTLKSWQFQVGPLQAAFDQVIGAVNGGSVAHGDFELRLPANHQPAAAAGVALPPLPLDSGYTVISGRKADDPKADDPTWYRGPFTPSLVAPLPADTSWLPNPLPSDDGATLAVSTTPASSAGPTMDRSHAAAWQIGRLLALADIGFATEQAAWKRDCRLALNRAIRNGGDVTAGQSRKIRAANTRRILADAASLQKRLGAALSVDPTVTPGLAIPQMLVDWLGRLVLLTGVPFHYLVPDPLMLPPESIRFFHVDPRWLACLLDGAWSVGREPAAHWAFDTAFQPWNQILNGSLLPSFTPMGASPWPAFGVLLQSRLISGYWPRITFMPDTAATLLREERLGPDSLLLLFDQPFTSLTIREPAEGIHFGFEMDDQGDLSKRLSPARLDTGSASAGQAPSDITLSSVPQRSGSGLIQFNLLAQAIATALEGTTTGAAPATGSQTFTTAEFAMLMVESVPSVTITLPTT